MTAITATPAAEADVLPLRVRQRDELRCQIVHDSLHRRRGWTQSYLLGSGANTAGFGSIAVAGPWADKPTVFEFYLRPEYRVRAFDLFESFLAASAARFFEVQSNDTLLFVMLHTYGRDIATEKIVFRDERETALAANGATLRRVTSEEESRRNFVERRGESDWLLEREGQTVARGGIAFHYNAPYGDIYLETVDSYRRNGYGSFLVQELKRICYELGGIPAARCNPANGPSRKTLQKAGMVPFAHILNGRLAAAPEK